VPGKGISGNYENLLHFSGLYLPAHVDTLSACHIAWPIRLPRVLARPPRSFSFFFEKGLAHKGKNAILRNILRNDWFQSTRGTTAAKPIFGVA
jgi:hypothetical protein